MDFIQKNHRGLVITTNKAVAISDLNIIKNYINVFNVIDSDDIISLRLPQFKLYLKILSIPYYMKDTNLPIITNIVKRVLQTTYIFNDIVLTSHPHIIKTSPKSDIAVI